MGCRGTHCATMVLLSVGCRGISAPPLLPSFTDHGECRAVSLTFLSILSACAVFFSLSEISFHQGTTSSAVGLSHGLRCLLELARSGSVQHGAGLSSQRPLQAPLPKPQHRHPIQKPKLLSFYHCACITHSFTCFWPLTLWSSVCVYFFVYLKFLTWMSWSVGNHLWLCCRSTLHQLMCVCERVFLEAHPWI